MAGNLPFGFNPGGDDPDDPSGGNPFGNMDMQSLGAAIQQFGRMLSSGGGEGTVNWTLAHDVARDQLAAAGADPSVGPADRRAVEEAVALANLWLDPVTAFPAAVGEPAAWSRAEWLEATLPAWQQMVGPIAEQVQGAMSSMLPGGAEAGLPAGLPPELAAMAGPLLGMAKQMGSAMFGMQVGQGLATLATEVVGAGDVGVPLVQDGRAALLPTNVAAFGAGLGIPADEVRLFLALREVAHQRLFTHVPWLRGRLAGAVDAYARGIHVDTERIQEALQGIDPSNPGAVQDILASGVFEPADTEAQQQALSRLETLLALVEGWVDAVVMAAGEARLPASDRLREAVRRRRAAGGPAEKTFATLVGLELRPRRLREAAALWEALLTQRDIAGRDAVWQHPDLLPTAEDLDDPDAFVRATLMLDDADLSALAAGPNAEPARGDSQAHEPAAPNSAVDQPGEDKADGLEPGSPEAQTRPDASNESEADG